MMNKLKGDCLLVMIQVLYFMKSRLSRDIILDVNSWPSATRSHPQKTRYSYNKVSLKNNLRVQIICKQQDTFPQVIGLNCLIYVSVDLLYCF